MNVLSIPRKIFEKYGQNHREKEGIKLADVGNSAVITYEENEVIGYYTLKIWFSEEHALSSQKGKTLFGELGEIQSGICPTGSWCLGAGRKMETGIWLKINRGHISLNHLGAPGVIMFTLFTEAARLANSLDCATDTWWENEREKTDKRKTNTR